MEQLDMATVLDNCCDAVNAAYRELEAPGIYGIVKRDWQVSPAQLKALFARVDAPETRLCKSGSKITAVVIDDWFVKRYQMRKFSDRVRKLFKLSRPERVLAGALRLREFEIPTPEVIGAFRVKKNFLPYNDYVVTRLLSEQQLMANAVAAELARGGGYRDCVIGATALLVKMHAAGVEHGDFNLRNIFCRRSPAGVFSDWGVIDLDGCRIYPEEMPENRRRTELARLISSFLLNVRHHAPEVKLNHDAVIDDFVRKYRELSGYNLGGSALDARVEYLCTRIRKGKGAK